MIHFLVFDGYIRSPETSSIADDSRWILRLSYTNSREEKASILFLDNYLFNMSFANSEIVNLC